MVMNYVKHIKEIASYLQDNILIVDRYIIFHYVTHF